MKMKFIAVFLAVLAVGVVFGQAPQRPGGGLLNRMNSQRNQRPGMPNRTPAGRNAGANAAGANEAAADAVKNAPRGTNGVPALVFDKAELEIVLKAYADEIKKTILPAPDLPKATITLKSLEGQVLSKDEYLEAIEVVLAMNGVVLEPRGEKFLRALARKTVRTQGIPVIMDNKGNLPEQGRVVSQMITFQNIAATEAQKALEGFKDPSGLFQVFERTNAILVTDTQENINRMLEIVRAIDIASPVTEEVFDVQVKYALAADIKTALETIVTESQKEQPKETVTTKTSGTPGFTRDRPTTLGSRLLNPGNRNPQSEAVKANDTLLAGISDADRGMIRGKVLILADERSNKLIIITSKANMKFFQKVIDTLDVETTPDVQIKVFRLKYAECEDVASNLNDLIGNASSGASQSKNNQNQNTGAAGTKSMTTGAPTAKARTKSSTGALNTSKVGELNKDNCKILADKRINGVVVYARTQDMSTLKRIIDDMDIKLSQVLIETVIIEVSLGDDLATGIDWVRLGAKQYDTVKTGQYVQKLTGYTEVTDESKKTSAGILGKDNKWYEPTYEWVEETTTKSLGRAGFINEGNNMLAGGGSNNDGTSALSDLTAFVVSNGVNGSINPIGSGVNYFLKSDKLNLGAVIEASKSDSRSKYLASPIVMTVDNKEASIEATEMKYLFKGYQYSGSTYNGSAVPDYEQKELGITVKVTPKINPDGTVMLTVEEEYSQEGNGQMVDGVQQATTVTRKMQADVLLDNMQTVVFGGLTETRKAEKTSGIPYLKDIPWIGKWLFGSVYQSDARKELLVFMTPYVLDEADAAQAEALRRKKALSDQRPWEDNGWSTSALADPVSKKEKLRRFQEEWSRQDEERKTKLAIEKAKVDRVKALEKMDKQEREFWLNLHKEELEKDEQKAFEEKLSEEKDLRELAKGIRARKMAEAEAELKKANAADKAEAERTADPLAQEAVKAADVRKVEHRDAADSKRKDR